MEEGHCYGWFVWEMSVGLCSCESWVRSLAGGHLEDWET